jgi:hypothetical protein
MGEPGPAGIVPVQERATFERDALGLTTTIRQEFSDGSTAVQSVQRDRDGRVVKIVRI